MAWSKATYAKTTCENVSIKQSNFKELLIDELGIWTQHGLSNCELKSSMSHHESIWRNTDGTWHNIGMSFCIQGCLGSSFYCAGCPNIPCWVWTDKGGRPEKVTACDHNRTIILRSVETKSWPSFECTFNLLPNKQTQKELTPMQWHIVQIGCGVGGCLCCVSCSWVSSLLTSRTTSDTWICVSFSLPLGWPILVVLFVLAIADGCETWFISWIVAQTQQHHQIVHNQMQT